MVPLEVIFMFKIDCRDKTKQWNFQERRREFRQKMYNKYLNKSETGIANRISAEIFAEPIYALMMELSILHTLSHLIFIAILCGGIINLIFSDEETVSKKLNSLPQSHMIFRWAKCVTQNPDLLGS